MSSRPRTPAAGRTAPGQKQFQAYLAAREVLRRIRRTQSLVEPLLARRPPPAAQPRPTR